MRIATLGAVWTHHCSVAHVACGLWFGRRRGRSCCASEMQSRLDSVASPWYVTALTRGAVMRSSRVATVDVQVSRHVDKMMSPHRAKPSTAPGRKRGSPARKSKARSPDRSPDGAAGPAPQQRQVAGDSSNDSAGAGELRGWQPDSAAGSGEEGEEAGEHPQAVGTPPITTDDVHDKARRHKGAKKPQPKREAAPRISRKKMRKMKAYLRHCPFQ